MGEATPSEAVVLVGSRKPVLNYILACLTFFNSGIERVVVRARGRAITNAVDVVNRLRSLFIKDLVIEDVRIGTEQLQRPDGRLANVSTIEIVITRGGEVEEEGAKKSKRRKHK